MREGTRKLALRFWVDDFHPLGQIPGSQIVGWMERQTQLRKPEMSFPGWCYLSALCVCVCVLDVCQSESQRVHAQY